MPLLATEIQEVWSHKNEKNPSSWLPPTFEDLQTQSKLKGIILLCWRFSSIPNLDTLHHNDHQAKGPYLLYNVMNQVAYGWLLTGSPIS